tara:strand:- start:96054 stop:96323 length:270 start_codon:yes stop_codon:yes gene_type:complete
MMNAETQNAAVADDIRRFLADECYVNLDDINDDTLLFTSGLLGSLDMIDLSAYIEEKYGIDVSDAEVSIEHFDSVQMIVAYVDARRQAA